jgi:type I restriction enzyme R subunit
MASGWLVQDWKDLDPTAGRNVGAREFPMKSGFRFADHLLYLDRKAVGAVAAKAVGTITSALRHARLNFYPLKFPIHDASL